MVDDLEENRFVLRELLRRFGISADEAEGGQQAISMIDQNAYDGVFMDMKMPGMDGFETVLRIREGERSRSSHVPIIAVTASTTAEYRKRCFEVGCDAFLPKPVLMGSLRQMINANLRGTA